MYMLTNMVLYQMLHCRPAVWYHHLCLVVLTTSLLFQNTHDGVTHELWRGKPVCEFWLCLVLYVCVMRWFCLVALCSAFLHCGCSSCGWASQLFNHQTGIIEHHQYTFSTKMCARHQNCHVLKAGNECLFRFIFYLMLECEHMLLTVGRVKIIIWSLTQFFFWTNSAVFIIRWDSWVGSRQNVTF